MAKSKENKDEPSKKIFKGKFGVHSSSAQPKPKEPKKSSTNSNEKKKI